MPAILTGLLGGGSVEVDFDGRNVNESTIKINSVSDDSDSGNDDSSVDYLELR